MHIIELPKLATFYKYFFVSCVAFFLDFSCAYILLRTGFPVATSLAIAAIIGSIIGYVGLELYVFTAKNRKLSIARFSKYCLGLLCIYIIRVVSSKLFFSISPQDQALVQAFFLFISYVFAFLCGYFVQSRLIFVQK